MMQTALDRVTLLQGDCRELLPAACPDPAVIVTDPPYGIRYQSGWAPDMPGAVYASEKGSIAGDEDGWAYEWLRDTYPDTPLAVFASWKNGPPWPGYVALLVWDKGGASGMGNLAIPWKPNHEPIYVYGRGWSGRRTGSVLAATVPSSLGNGRVHPHQKPVEVLAEIISKAPEGIVLDPFAGSGSTLLAAAQLGRPAVGVEVESIYVEACRRRLKDQEADDAQD